MAVFGDKDQIIAILQEQVAYLRAELEKVNKTNLALMNAHAYRILHGGMNEPPALPFDPEKSGDPIVMKATELRPGFSLENLKAEFEPVRD
jgi:hypothetical protein